MRKELENENLEAVSGGRYIINGDLHQIAFRDVRKVYKLSPSCNDYEVMEVCDSFIGVYGSEEEYDNACIAALKERGWI